MARKSKLTCGNCRRPVKASWLGCPHCLKPNAGYRPPGAKKTARPAVGKVGSARCPVGHLARAGAMYCGTCRLPMQPADSLKAAMSAHAEQRRQDYIAKIHASYKSDEREALWAQMRQELGELGAS
jgi:hypothetical protein